MVFRKKISHYCAYCAHAGRIDEHQLICSKKGIVAAADQCFRFRYDPLKRIPPRPKAPTLKRYDDKDFQL